MYKLKIETWHVQFLETTVVMQVKIEASSYKKALDWAKENADDGQEVRVWRSTDPTRSTGETILERERSK